MAPRGDADAAPIEDAQGLLVPAVLLADQLPRREAHVVEHDLGGVARPEAELLDLPSGAEAGRPLFDDEGRDAAVAEIRGRRGEHDVHVPDGPLRDEHLRPVEEPAVGVTHGARPQPARVAPRARLGQAPGTEPLAARQARQVAPAERLACKQVDVSRGEPGMARDRQPERRVVARHAFDDEGAGERVGPAAADVARQPEAEEPERR